MPRGSRKHPQNYSQSYSAVRNRRYRAQKKAREDSGDPTAWIKTYCCVALPGKGERPLKPYPYQEQLWSDRSPQRIILKSRQVGVSRAVACEAVHKAITRPGSTILFVSRSHEAARNLIRYAWGSIRKGVADDILPKPSAKNTTSIEWEDLNSRIVSISAKPDAARSYAATDVYLDEAAYPLCAEELFQGLAPTVSTGGTMTVLSTPHGRGNLFHRLWETEEAQDFDGEAIAGNWSRHRVHWSDRPDYTQEWADKERKKHTQRSWAEEYELSFEESGKSVFAESKILSLLCEPRLPAPPYFAGLDLARQRDYTCLAILDGTGQLVQLLRINEQEWQVQIAQVALLMSHYGGAHLISDATAVGDPLYESLRNIAAETAQPGKRPAWSIEPFVYTTDSRALLMQNLAIAVEHRSVQIPNIPENQVLLREMRAFLWKETQSGRATATHPPGGHDDCIQALALAWKGMRDKAERPVRTTPALAMVTATAVRPHRGW